MIIPAVLAAIVLGGAFDLTYVHPNRYLIFDEKDIEAHLQVIPTSVNQSGYLIPKTAAEIDDFLDVHPALSLKSRLGDIELDRYFAYKINRETTIEILMRMYIEVETHTFPPKVVKVGTGWQGKPQKYVGTHYVKSTIHGGQMVISYQITPSKQEYFDEIRSAIHTAVGDKGALDDNFFGNLKKVLERFAGKFTNSVSCSGTAIPFLVPFSNLPGIQNLIKKFQQKLKTSNGGLLKIELEDISTVQSNYSAFVINDALVPALKEANDKFDDIRVTYDEFTHWQRQVVLDDDQDRIANAFWKQLKRARLSLLPALRKVDIAGSEHQFDEAFEVYNDGQNVSYKYLKQLMDMERTFAKKSF